jgi:hypothetical protein
MPEIYGLEATAAISEVKVTGFKDGLLGRRIELLIQGSRRRGFELSLNDFARFQKALQGEEQQRPGDVLTTNVRPDRPRSSWRLWFFRIFAVVWGLGAGTAGISGLNDDIRFRSHGTPVAARMSGHTGEIGARNEMGVLQDEVDGRPYTLTSLRGPGIYRIGDLENIRYLPEDPATAREDDYLPFDLLWVALGRLMFGLGVTLGGIVRAFRRAMNA